MVKVLVVVDLVMDKQAQEAVEVEEQEIILTQAVSYTHLTLPTNREV